ncbi:MAG: TolC family protein [Saprospiraceae bacterium]|nr:TolC family protein [Saprospiraceae bacterium]
MKLKILLAVFTLPWSLGAQDIWSLEKCVKYAIEHNTSLKLSELNIGLSEINLAESKWRRLPNLNANLNGGINFGRNIDPTSNDFITENILYSNYGINSGVSIFQGGAITNTIKQNKLTKQANTLDHQQNINDISLFVANAYLQVLLAKDRIQIAKNNVENVRAQLNQMKKLIQAGGKAESDALEIEAQLARSEQLQIGANNALELAWLQLRQTMKFDPSAVLEIERIPLEELDKIVINTYTVEQLISHAITTQPNIAAAKTRLEAAKISERIARSTYYPSVFMSANYGSRYSDAALTPTGYTLKRQQVPGIFIDGKSAVFEQTLPSIEGTKVTSFSDQFDQFLGYGLGVSISLPIYNNHSTRTNIARSKIQIESNKLQLEQSEESLRQNIYQAMTNFKAAQKEYEASEKSMLAAKQSFEKTKKRFEIGSVSSFEMNLSQTNFQNSEMNWVISKYDLVFKSKVLDYYAGKKIN